MGMKHQKGQQNASLARSFRLAARPQIRPTDSTRIDVSYSYPVLGGVGNTSQSSRVQDGGKSRHAERSANNVHSAELSKNLVRTFTRRNCVEVAGV